MGPSERQLAEAENLLSQRKYYELYEEIHARAGRQGRTVTSSTVELTCSAFRYRFEAFQGEDIIPQPGAELVDLGCGVGENAVYFAQLGYRVTGIDVSGSAVEMARERAQGSGTSVTFTAADILDLSEDYTSKYDLAVDVGCLHMLVLSGDRTRYLRTAHRILRPGGAFVLYERVSRRDIVLKEEYSEVLNQVSFIYRRMVGDGRSIEFRGAGGRRASLRQYRRELEAAGFEVLKAERAWDMAQRFAIFLATKRARASPLASS